MKLTSVLSWAVILVIAVGMPVVRVVMQASATTQPTSSDEPIDLQYTLAAKYLLGAGKFSEPAKQTVLSQLDEASKDPTQKAAAAVVAGEIEGKEAALTRLSQIDSPDATALRAWYGSQTPLPSETVKRLDWFAKLAQISGMPESDPARKSVTESITIAVVAVMVFGGLLAIAGLAGLCLLVTGIILLALGKMRFRMTAPQGASHVYVEAFAIYLSTFLIGSIVIAIWFADSGMLMHVMPLIVGIVIAVAWPVLRGVSFTTQRADWGIHTGANVMLEAIFGILGYLAGLPIVAIMLLVTVALTKLSGTSVSHPIATEIAEHPWMMFFLAVVFAPITEELLFRGAFVSHLRGSVGIVLSATISGFIFAAIHPQGWAAIPVLMGVGAVLALIRQWRDSLVASITAHALNNGCLVGLMIVISQS